MLYIMHVFSVGRRERPQRDERSACLFTFFSEKREEIKAAARALKSFAKAEALRPERLS